MKLFRCFIRGENFPGKLLHQKKRVGFYTTRFIKADTPEQAELLAVEQLRADPDLHVAEKYRSQDAKVYLERIEEVTIDATAFPNRGFTFFTM